MISQIALIREFTIVFYGNELAIGIILGNWLWWTGVGSWLGARISKKIRHPLNAVALLQAILAFLVMAVILGIRGIKFVSHTASGEILGIAPIWLWSFLLVSLLCIVNGFLFTAACNAYRNYSKRDAGYSIGSVYIIEAAGAATGGILYSIFLVNYFNPFQILWGLSLVNMVSAAGIWKGRGRWVIYTAGFICLALGISFINKLNTVSRTWQWPGYTVIKSADSYYGNITVTKQGPHYNFYENGLLSYSIPDKMSCEWSVHPALLQAGNRRRILLIGGGINGSLKEILKYPSIKRVDYVELDPLAIKLADEVLPDKETASLRNPKVHLYNMDGRRFLKANSRKYDVIIVNLPDPYTAQLNRFYTLEFFKDTALHLAPDGIIYLGVNSAENYISPVLGDFLRSIYYTLKEVYPEVKVIPGQYNYFIGAKIKGTCTDDYRVLDKRLHAYKIATPYVNDYYLKYRLSRERIKYLNSRLDLKKPHLLNMDFHPISYYYDITFWSTYFNSRFKKVFVYMAGIKLRYFFIPAALAFIWYFIPRKKRGAGYVLLPIAVSGFSEISFQVVTLLAFQVIYGYVYYKLGIILTSFMIGLALGGYAVNRIMPRIKNDYSVFVNTQIAITIYPLILPLIFYIFAKAPGLSFVGENFIFPFIPIIAGFVGGFQFPLGNKIYLAGRQDKDIGRAGGITYGLDLFGACIGAFVISAFIVPILGIMQTCYVTVLINLSVLIILLHPVYRSAGRPALCR